MTRVRLRLAAEQVAMLVHLAGRLRLSWSEVLRLALDHLADDIAAADLKER